MLSRRHLIAAALYLGIAPAMAQTPAPAVPAPVTPLPVVATFSILGDFVREVGGNRVTLTTLVGPNGDGHVYSPTPVDARRVADAKLVVVNGLKFEGWIDRLIKASGTKAPVVVATKSIKPLKTQEDNHKHGHSHDHGVFDPHAWQDVRNARVYVTNIRDALIAADPDGRAVYEANAGAYLVRLDALDAEIREAVARIPADRRRVITSHDAFAYFEAAYRVDFVAPQGVSTEAEASARDVGRIIRQIRNQKIPAVFMENVTDQRLIERIAKETGARIGGRLYSDALSTPDGNAGTYIEMMRHNIRAISSALVS
jgi:zinc/manganese transport system substrate-binding protein